MENVEKYVNAVTRKKKRVCKWNRLAVERFLHDWDTAEKKGLYFDHDAVERVLQFCGLCRHSKGEWAGQPFEPADWQEFCLANMFGWKWLDDGTRRFRAVYIEVPRKNGKSTLLAVIGNYLFVADGEPGAEVYAAATKRDQAKIIWNESKRMIQSSPELKKRVEVWKSSMDVVPTSSMYEPLGRDADTVDGLNIHAALIDELHAHANRDLWDVLVTGTGSRRQSMIIAITTAGYNKEGICYQQKRACEKILEGRFKNDERFAFITGVDEQDRKKWWNEKCWGKANPNLGVSVYMRDMRALCKDALEMPSQQNAFLCKRLNIWTEQSERWISMADWDQCIDPSTKPDDLLGLECYGGLDLSSVDDITALVLYFILDGKPNAILPFFWIPEENVKERSRRDDVPYDVWVKAGLIRTTPGNVIDHNFVRRDIVDISERHKILEIGFDDWGAMQITQQLTGDGIVMTPMRQGYKTLSPPTKELERLYKSKKINHFGNEVLSWMADNAAIMRDPADNIKPAKDKSEDRIDGIVGLVMAIGRAMFPDEDESSVYEERGIYTL